MGVRKLRAKANKKSVSELKDKIEKNEETILMMKEKDNIGKEFIPGYYVETYKYILLQNRIYNRILKQKLLVYIEEDEYYE